MAEKNVTVISEEQVSTEPFVVKQDFWTAYSKPVIYIGAALILLVGGSFGYKKLVKEPKELKAAETIFPAEAIFDKMANSGFSPDSVNLVLNGGATTEGSKVTGILKVMSTYGGTKAANRAAYMAGATYLQVKNFDNAIKYLKEFDANGAYQIETKKYIMLGHAYAEQKKTEDALSAYKKAASINEKDETFTAEALMYAASYAEATGKPKEAIEMYQKLKDKYPASQFVQSGDADKYLARLGIIK